MDQLQPSMHATSDMRSFSAGSYGSSNGSASSTVSAQDSGAHTPSTSPSLSDRDASSTDTAAWTKLPNHHPSSNSASRSGSSAALSPLELLVKRGMQVQNDILAPDDRSATNTSSSHILERASALSRKTSVRKPPIQPSPDPDDFDDTQSIRSVNLLSEPGSSFSRSQLRSSPSSSASSPPSTSSSFSVQRGYKASYDDSNDSYTPTQPDAPWQRSSSHLLSNAFRNSVASDISFNSITADALDSSLSRRASIDTVRSSEFGEDGRWGRAWTSRADDEESAYEESSYGDDLDSHLDDELSGVIHGSIDLDPSKGPLLSSRGLDSVTQQWKRSHASHSTSRGSSTNASSVSSRPAIRQVESKEKIVSLTRSVPPHTASSKLQQPTHIHADPRHSFVPQIETQEHDARPHSTQLYDLTPTASADRYLGRPSASSVATIAGNSLMANTDSPPTARVYVYPPSPSGSEVSSSTGGAAASSSSSNYPSQQHYVSMPTPASAQVETMAASPQQNLASEVTRTPLAPSSLLSQPLRASARQKVPHRPRSSGHPAGRVPPPPPPAASGSEQSNIHGYSDPNHYFQGVDRPIIGRKRAEAIARADGRESMVSDLDVETLRLDGSSRRDSSSTIGSVMTSRLSIGSISHDPVMLQSSAAWRPHSSTGPSGDNAQPSVQPKASQNSFRSLQPVQDTASMPTASGDSMNPMARPQLRNAKSTNALPSSSLTGSVDMQATASAPQSNPGFTGLATCNATPVAKPRPSPAVDTRTGPSSAEDFLSQGITYHEQGDLARSAFYFERSAKVDGGCVVGMCMFGMTLREGWGARKDPIKGFTWIQRAAARAGEMMSTRTPKTDSELKAIKSELKLSVYELGKCFCYGWGVKMDKHMALEYFELAAKLGDADAQAEAGALYAAGKGCKKDLKKAAMYYRMAEEGGYDTVGLSWIHKDKYK